VGAVFCDWGANVNQSKLLIESEGLTENVLWSKPMAIIPFERMAKTCDIVVDQFKIGAFGGVLFKSMAVGAPILTYLNESKVLEQYSEVPPVINCASREEIVEKVSLLLKCPEKLQALSNQSRAWINKYHSKADTVNLQIDQFRLFLTKANRSKFLRW
jgi:hypothetical protein